MKKTFTQVVRQVDAANQNASFVRFRERHTKIYGVVMSAVAVLMFMGFYYQDVINNLPNKDFTLMVRAISAGIIALIGTLIFFSSERRHLSFLLYSAFYISTLYNAYITYLAGGIETSYWFGQNFLLLFWLMFIQFSYRLVIFQGLVFIFIFWLTTYTLQGSVGEPARFIEINMLLLGSILIGGTKAFLNNKNSHDLYQKQSALKNEIKRSDELLLNILPKVIADRLKNGEQNLVNSYENISVLFTDLVGFTKLASEQKPELVVEILNTIFTRFDELCEKYDLEKIKTIGDSYMVIGGAPVTSTDHTERCLRLAKEMLSTFLEVEQEYNVDLSIRIGVHNGSAIAGVIGKRKFTYDLWGDTVNTASRMESHGTPNRIHVSESVYNITKNLFTFEERGFIDIKNKEQMKTYFLVS